MTFTFPTITSEFYLAALPVLALCVGALVAMLQAVFRSIGSSGAVMTVLLATIGVALISVFMGMPEVDTAYLHGSYLSGTLSRFGQAALLAVGAGVALLYRDTFLKDKFYRGEIASLYLMILAGMLVMISCEEMISLFVGLELSSIGLYAIVGYLHPSRRSQEGAIKYFVLGSTAAALMMFGFGLLYAATGSMNLTEIVEAIPRLAGHKWVELGVVFTLVGLGFKLALAPFHLWAPDTYEAAPTGITAFMATSVKIMIIIVTLRLFAVSLSPVFDVWLPALMFLAIISMILGNIMALVQMNLKRMLAYSSIAHSGYMAIAICAMAGTSGELPISAILFYLVGYAIISIGAFGVLMWLENENNDNLLLDDLTGLAKRHPWAAFALAGFMFSFAGMPPSVGFMGKFFVFNAALANQLYSLVVIGIIGSSISLYYYLRVIVRMYMSEPVKVAAPLAPRRSPLVSVVLGTSLALTLLLGTLLVNPMLQMMIDASEEVTTYDDRSSDTSKLANGSH